MFFDLFTNIDEWKQLVWFFHTSIKPRESSAEHGR